VIKKVNNDECNTIDASTPIPSPVASLYFGLNTVVCLRLWSRISIQALVKYENTKSIALIKLKY